MGAAEKGWDSFLWEQRIDSIWRILLTMGDRRCTNVEGCLPREAPTRRLRKANGRPGGDGRLPENRDPAERDR